MSYHIFFSILIICVSVGLYGAIHSWLASLRVKVKVQHKLGPKADHSYRLIYNLLAILTLLPVLALPAALPDQRVYAIPMPWNLLSLALQGIALLVLLLGVIQTGVWSFLGLRQLFESGKPSVHLVTNGLYQYVRHPLYTAGLVLIWLIPVMTVNTLALDIGLTLYILIGIHYEERKLVREFGPTYEAYRQRTPMLIPKLSQHAPAITE